MSVDWRYDTPNKMRIETFDPVLVEEAQRMAMANGTFSLFGRTWVMDLVEWDTNNGRGLTAVIEAKPVMECKYADPAPLWMWQ
jgi:hypothetical protein